MNNFIFKKYLSAIIVTLVIFATCADLHARNLSLSGDWDYKNSKNDSDEFTENYTVDFNHQIFINPAMSVDTSIRYNRRQEVDNTRDNVSPTITYILKNDLFFLNLSGNANEQFNSNQKDTSNRSFDANWNSTWQSKRWTPDVTANYNRNWVKDNLEPRMQDSDSTNTGLSLAWDDLPVTGFYSYNWQEDNNSVRLSRHRSFNHLGRLGTSGSFWSERGRISLSQQYSYTENENKSRVEGGFALIRVFMTAYSDEVDSALDVVLPVNSALTNGAKTDSALTVNDPADPDRMTIAVKPNFQQVDKLYLYTVDTLTNAISSQFTWDLYFSNNNNNWTLAQASITASYDNAQKAFILDISGYQKDFLRVVAVDDPNGTAVVFGEAEVYKVVNSTDDSVIIEDNQTIWTSDVDISLQLRPDLSLTTGLSYEQNDYSASADLKTTKVSSGLRWEISQDMFFDFTGSYTSRQRDDAPEEQYRTYGFNFTAPLLPSVDTVWGATLSEDYEDSTKLSTSYNYNLHVVADLYTDLDSRLNLSYDQTENEITGARSNTSKASLNLTARLIPGLVANYSSNYTKTSGESDIIDMDLDFHWRKSNMLVLRSAVRQSWASEDSTIVSFGADLALTRKMQISLNHAYSFNPEKRHVTSLDWRWTVSDYISVVTTGSYENGDDDLEEWSFLSRLNARFADL